MFRKPRDDEKPEHVAIKCLNINVVEIALRERSYEDPYRGIHRMQTIGDNIHVLGCIEELRDEENMYIVRCMSSCHIVKDLSCFRMM